MRTAQFVSQERAIAAADAGTIRGRWFWGLRALQEAMTESGKSLRHGEADRLIAASAKAGIKLSKREIQWRIQCARAYPKESQIRNAVTDFGAWRELIAANFPPYGAPAEEPLADYRTEAEKRHDRSRELLDRVGDQGALFPYSEFEPAEATIKDLRDYADEQHELTSRFVAHDEKRFAYLDRLSAAAGGDESMTWEAAHALLPDDEPEALP